LLAVLQAGEPRKALVESAEADKYPGSTVERPFRAHAETEVLVNALSDRLGTPKT